MKKALIVVDFQNDFVAGSLGFGKAAELEPVICEKITRFREDGGDIIFTFDTHQGDYLSTQEGQKLPIPHCLEGSYGWQLYGKVAALDLPGDKKIKKETFGSLDLAAHCKERGYDFIELAGLVSNICVLSNAVILKAALPEARVVVDSSATACADDSLTEKALAVMASLQIEII